jgi:hypothetical protein
MKRMSLPTLSKPVYRPSHLDLFISLLDPDDPNDPVNIYVNEINSLNEKYEWRYNPGTMRFGIVEKNNDENLFLTTRETDAINHQLMELRALARIRIEMMLSGQPESVIRNEFQVIEKSLKQSEPLVKELLDWEIKHANEVRYSQTLTEKLNTRFDIHIPYAKRNTFATFFDAYLDKRLLFPDDVVPGSKLLTKFDDSHSSCIVV